MPHKDPEERKAYLREYAKKNPAYARVKAWREKNPDLAAVHSVTYAEKHPEVLAAKARRYRIRHIEMMLEKDRKNSAEYRAKNPQKVVESKAKYAKQNRFKINANIAKRNAAKLQRTPAWLTEDDFWMIEQAYELSALRTKMFGFSWHVDHVIPLQGKLVSGLHTPYNLQVIPAVENLRKNNRMEIA